MKVLVTYYTMTGNTEQIAKAINEEVSKAHESQLKKIEEVEPGSLGEYDLIFVGAPVHAGGIAAPANEFLGNLPHSPKFKLAGFLTHCSPAYEPVNFERALQTFVDTSKDKGVELQGRFECQGRLSPDLHSMIKQVRGFTDEQWAEFEKEMKEHPNAEDEQKSKEFARDVLSKT